MKLHRFITWISILLLLPVFFIQVLASEGAGILNLSCSTHVNGERRYIVGDEFALVKIADAEVIRSEENPIIRYRVLPKYESLGWNWENMTAEEFHAKAKQAASMVTDEECMASVVTDEQGKASFADLAPAMYLIVRTKVAPHNGSFYVDPFLVSVPMLWEGAINDTVTASLKCGWKPQGEDDPPAEPQDPDNPGGNAPELPQTGQLQWPIPVLIVSGGLLLWLGWKEWERLQENL